jgi:hypothetical protein
MASLSLSQTGTTRVDNLVIRQSMSYQGSTVVPVSAGGEFDTTGSVMHIPVNYHIVVTDSSLIQTGTKIPLGWYTNFNITVTALKLRLYGGSSPSVTADLHFGTDISAAGTALITTPDATTTTTVWRSITTFNNANIDAGSSVWLEFDAKSGITKVTPTYLEIVLIGKGR